MKKWILLMSGMIVIVLAIFGGWKVWQHTAFQGRPFGLYYGVDTVFFHVTTTENHSVEIPKYALSDTGELLGVDGNQTDRLAGPMKRIALSETNFDQIFHEDGQWGVMGIDAQSAREWNLRAWHYQKWDGSFYYVLLQNNGDVFLCIGEKGKIVEFIWVQPLMKY